MAYTDEGLKDKVGEMYPEIQRRGISECIYLGVQIGEFIRNFEEAE